MIKLLLVVLVGIGIGYTYGYMHAAAGDANVITATLGKVGVGGHRTASRSDDESRDIGADSLRRHAARRSTR